MDKKLIKQEVVFPPQDIDTYGLTVVRQDWEGEESYYKFDLYDGVQVLPFDENGKVIAIRQERNGVSYLGLVGETMTEIEQFTFRKAVVNRESTEIALITKATAKRGLRGETGYEAEWFEFLTSGLVNSGKGIPSHCFVVARNCRKISEPEKGIRVELWDPQEFFLALKAQFLAWPVAPKAGTNSLLAVALGLNFNLQRFTATDEFRGTPTVVALRGIPLTGKSVLGEELSKHLGWKFIDVDAIRRVVAGGETDRLNPYVDDELAHKEGEDMRIAYTVMHESVRANINLGRSVICAATYSKRAAQKFLLDVVTAHPCAKLRGIRCRFNDTDKEILRRITDRKDKTGGCKTIEHYKLDRDVRHDYTDLWGVREINTSESLGACVVQAIQFIES